MRYSPIDENGFRRRRILIAIVTTIALLVAASTYAVMSRDNSSSPVASISKPGVLGPSETTPNIGPTTGTLPVLDSTADPESFALLVAHAIFDWDTAKAVPLSAYTSRLVAVADPTGESSAGLVADVAAYLPTETVWDDLRRYSTRQWLTVETIVVPSLWSKAEAEAGSDGLLPGTTRYTVTGIRHRSGIWEDEPVTSAHGVAFTVFIVCAPSYPTCHVLRLSRLDDPLG